MLARRSGDVGGAWLDGSIDQCRLDPGPRDALASQHQPPARFAAGEWAGPPVLDQYDEADCAGQEAGGSQGDVVLAQQPTEPGVTNMSAGSDSGGSGSRTCTS